MFFRRVKRLDGVYVLSMTLQSFTKSPDLTSEHLQIQAEA